MKRLFITLLMIVSIAFISPFEAYADNSVERISGQNRAETAVKISKDGWASGADTVILATGQDYADALSSSTLAFALDAPILLASFPDRLSEATLNELKRLNPDRVIIIGGEKAINKSLKQDLEAADYIVDRISGSDRFQTGVKIAEEVLALNPAQKEIIIAKGLDFPDALSSASHAANEGIPIILTLDDRLPKSVQAFLDKYEINKSIVVGGEKAIHPNVVQTLSNAERVYGNDRYSTAVALANYFETNLQHIYIATGQDFPDALTGSVLAAKNNGPVLLTPKNRLLDSVIPMINQASNATIFGGESAINNAVLNKISKELKAVEVVEKEEKEIFDIDFKTIEKEDPTLNKGETKVEQEGKKGIKEVTYIVTYVDGKQTSKEIIKSEVIEEPIDEVILVGVKPILLELNKPYVSIDNNMTVTMKNIEIIEEDGFNLYNFTYEEFNNTDQVIDQGAFKIYFTDGDSEPQYGFFGKLYPGERTTREYSFKYLKSKEPLLIEYGSDLFFNTSPSEDTLKWK